MRRILALLCLLTATGAAGFLIPNAEAGKHSSHSSHSYGHHERPGDRQLAQLAVDNDRFSSVEVRIDGRLVGTVGPSDREMFSVAHGGQDIVITSGAQVVYSRSTLFRRGETIEADIPAYEGKLAVTNSTGFSGRLYVDGVDRGAIEAGTQRTLILPPCSGARVEIRGPNYTLDSKTVSLISGKTTRFNASAPTLADVSIRNPLTVAVTVTVGQRGSITVMPGRKVTLSKVPVGDAVVTVRLESGRIIETARVDVRPYAGGRIVIEGPSAAAVAVHNIGRADARVWIDGSLVSRVDAYGDELLDLPVGDHRVIVRDASGDTLLNQSFTVTPFSANELVFGAATCTMPASDDRAFSASISW